YRGRRRTSPRFALRAAATRRLSRCIVHCPPKSAFHFKEQVPVSGAPRHVWCSNSANCASVERNPVNATASTAASPSTTAPPLQSAALETLFQRLSELSSLPGVALRIIEAAVDEDSDAHDLRQLIEHDPALAARIIRVVNSSYFAVRQEVADLN